MNQDHELISLQFSPFILVRHSKFAIFKDILCETLSALVHLVTEIFYHSVPGHRTSRDKSSVIFIVW